MCARIAVQHFADDGGFGCAGGSSHPESSRIEQNHQARREIGVLEKERKLAGLIVPARQEAGDGAEAAVRDAIETASKRLPSYQRITDFAITPDALPRTRLGKIQHHLLMDLYNAAKEGGRKAAATGPISENEMAGEDRALLEDAAAKAVWQMLAERYRDKRLTPDTNPRLDLGIDSLEWLNLTLQIAESSRVELTEDAIARIETVRDLLREVAEGGGGEAIDPLEQPEKVLSEKQRRWLEPRGPLARIGARILFACNRRLMRLFFRVRAEGLEHLPKSGPWVLAPNHASFLDPFAIAAVLDWRHLRDTYWAALTGIAFANPIVRFGSRLGKALPVEPMRAARSSVALGAIVLKRGKNLVWFPEGERSASGELQEFKPGIGMLLEHFGTPVIPVFIHGSHAALPPGRLIPRPARIRVVFGKPLDPAELQRKAEPATPREAIASGLHDRVAELSPLS